VNLKKIGCQTRGGTFYANFRGEMVWKEPAASLEKYV